jgi:hypothetical protein
MGWFSGLIRRPCPVGTLLSLDEVLDALGDDGIDSRRTGSVPLADVVGSVNRFRDFDASFRLTNPALCERWSQVSSAVRAGRALPPVALVQVGELYFVSDGHHRVSVACSRGGASIPARVLRVCSVAYAACRLRRAHLASKRAERQFLERVPLGQPVRQGLWLDRPEDWVLLADAAERWWSGRGYRPGLDRRGAAAAWWAEEVEPVLARWRRDGSGREVPGLQAYVDTLRSGA